MPKLRVISGGKDEPKSERQIRNEKILKEARLLKPTLNSKGLPKRCDALELEYKYQIKSEDALPLQGFIERHFPVERQFSRFYQDHYYTLSGLTQVPFFLRYRKHLDLLGNDELTVKRFQFNHPAVCQEVNMKFKGNTLKEVEEGLRLSGFTNTLNLTKHSRILLLPEVAITIDKVDGKNHFVEIEARNTTNTEAALKLIEKWEANFKGMYGIKKSNRDPRCMFEIFGKIKLLRGK